MARPVPNLFVVGAPRCGTTAMFRLLAQHPDIAVCDPKEPYYFCTDFHEESDRHAGRATRFPVRTEAQYLALFDDRSRTVVAEATPAYLYSTVAASRIHAFNPGARILVMVRDPVELLHSLHAKMVSYRPGRPAGLSDRDSGRAGQARGAAAPARSLLALVPLLLRVDQARRAD